MKTNWSIFKRLPNMNYLLHNRGVLYLLVAIACINVISNALANEYLIPSLFFLVGFIASFFYRNMIIVLAIAIGVSNMVKYFTKIHVHVVNEGMTTEEETSKDKEKKENENKDKDKDSKNKEEEKDSSSAMIKRKSSPTDPAPAPDRSKMDPAALQETRMQLKELTKLHDTINQSMTTMEESLRNAERIFDKVKDGFENRRM